MIAMAKQFGRVIGNVATLVRASTRTIQTDLDAQLQGEEIRRAQQDLTEVFSGLKANDDNTDNNNGNSIDRVNSAGATDNAVNSSREEVDSTLTATQSNNPPTAAAAAAMPVPRKRKTFRRKRLNRSEQDHQTTHSLLREPKTTPNELSSPPSDSTKAESLSLSPEQQQMTEEISKSRMARLERLKGTLVETKQPPPQPNPSNTTMTNDTSTNDSLALIMKRLQKLDQEKAEVDSRLQEEFQSRQEASQRAFEETRRLLEQAVATVSNTKQESTDK